MRIHDNMARIYVRYRDNDNSLGAAWYLPAATQIENKLEPIRSNHGLRIYFENGFGSVVKAVTSLVNGKIIFQYVWMSRLLISSVPYYPTLRSDDVQTNDLRLMTTKQRNYWCMKNADELDSKLWEVIRMIEIMPEPDVFEPDA